MEPDEFVAVAEETGLIVPLGHFVLREAAKRAAQWGVPVSVNISARQLADPDLPRAVEDALIRSGARPGDLRLEVTESAMAHDAEVACETLAELHRRLGVGAHLDDFGTGASSLRFLHRFPGDALKVDRSLVIGMLTDVGSHAIVKAVVGLAHNLGMEVVGEGVESAAHLDALAELGCESPRASTSRRRSPRRRRRTCSRSAPPPRRARRRRCCRSAYWRSDSRTSSVIRLRSKRRSSSRPCS